LPSIDQGNRVRQAKKRHRGGVLGDRKRGKKNGGTRPKSVSETRNAKMAGKHSELHAPKKSAK